MAMDVSNYLLAAILYDVRVDDASPFLSARKLQDVERAFERRYKARPSAERLSPVVEILKDDGIISVVSDPLASDYFYWNKARSHSIYNSLQSSKDSPYYKASQLGNTWLQEVLANIVKLEASGDEPVARPIAPAADRLVAINHNSAAWQDIRDKAEQLEDMVRADNSDTISDPEERGRLRVQVEAGRKLLSVRNLSLAALGATIIPALKALATSFGDEAIGQLASSLVEAILKALGVS